MSVFPQLASGASAQFPFRSSIRFRTLVNRFSGGEEVRHRDVDVEERRWELFYEGLTDAEWDAIRALFEQCEGRLGEFVFVEPGQNLLAWSQSLERAEWQAAGVGVIDGRADPFGGVGGAAVNGLGTLSQTLQAPGSLRLAGSLWARTGTAGAGFRVSDGAGLAVSQNFVADAEWRRYEVRYPGGSSSQQTVFTIFGGGGEMDIFGPQLEAQVAASAYKSTAETGGVFVGARFDQDVLEDRLIGVGRHSGVVRIQWQRSQV